ncbi:TonB-dependent receptor [Terriglobus roseus]|uniref:Carboxypeptidase regulatory-like domain-containing protein n=1 Tax=Terriglobus roseus TaxID=392734 RepID=A0A1H4JBB2_9BACT|nr:TonB-dependent receptor [Terriglobus roseus]SEB43266.1 Carboxypeptidase regulatory-like domain-containing protein [Terriglobus roseus]
MGLGTLAVSSLRFARYRSAQSAVLSLALLLSVPAAFAQLDNGSITGTLRDAAGAVIPGASVTIRNTATGVATTLKTNGDGSYQALALIPGTYTVEATASGFSTARNANVEVHVKTRAQIDFSLMAGSATDTVEVVSTVQGLQTQSADVGNVIGTTQINDLPLNARRYADLALLEPGIFKNPGAANPAPDRFSSNGNLETQNYFALDGVDNNSGSTNLQEGSVQNVQPPPDAIQEFRLQTRTYSAEFGTSAGAVVNATTKSGTNQIHGSVWEYARNSVFDANSWANKHVVGIPLAKGNFSQNQFGGTVGGHVVRDRFFYFGDYQGLRSTQSTTVSSVVPSAAMKTGDLREVTFNPVGQLPGQTGCIVAKVIQPSCIDPVARAIAALLPNPNNATGAWNGTPNYVYQYQLPQQVNSFDTRIDYTVTQRNQLFTRYSFLDQHRQDPPWTGNSDIGNGGFATDYKIRNQEVAFGLTTTLSSSAVNQFRFGWGRDSAHSNPIGVTLGTSAAPSVGLTGIPVTPQSGGLPPINISGGFRRIGVDLFRPQFQAAGVWQFLDNFTKLKGNHSMLFGYEYHRNTNNFLDLTAPQGYMSFSGVFTNTNGFGWPDFLLGNVNQTIFNSYLVVHNYQFGHSFFAQDTWRASQRLTIVYGTRYELYSPMLNRTNSFSNFDGSGAGSLTVARDGNWFQRSLVKPDKNNFAPRVGFSFQASKKMVLRGGYGVFYQYYNRIGSEAALGQNQPFLKFVNDARTTVASGTVFQLRNGFPGPAYANATTPLYIQKSNWQDPNQRTSYVQQFSLGPQFQLSPSTTVEVVYVGNLGHKMNRLRNANQGLITGFSGATPTVAFPYANLNNGGTHAFLELATNDGNTNYNGLVSSVRRQMTKGLGYQISYTYAHNFSDYADNLTAGSTPQNAYDYEHEYSQSPFDQRHRLVLSAQWKLPIGQNGLLLNNTSFAAKALGGWQYNIIATFESGNPFNVTAADNSQTGGNHAAYANCLAGAFNNTTHDRNSLTSLSGTAAYINPAAFTQPGAGTFGTCRPRAFAGPGRRNFDMSLFKQFAFTDTRRLEFRLEGFNVFNHANLANPAASVSTPGTFGRISGVVNTARQVQLAGKFYF